MIPVHAEEGNENFIIIDITVTRPQALGLGNSAYYTS